MINIETKLQLAKSVCLNKGKKLTIKREQILTLLLGQTKAISVYELIDLFPKHFQESISPISAYRILSFLEELELVHKINIANKYIACAHIGDDHSHDFPQFLICKECQSVNELDCKTNHLSDISLQAQEVGYQLSSPQIELSCICNGCL